MTVEELFEHFDEYFDKINFFDTTNNIEDKVEKDNSECPNLQAMLDNFIEEYGEYNVADWKYSAYANSIYIEIECNGVVVTCYGKTEHWNSRQEAIDYYLEGMLSCEGSEQERYTKIYSELISGYKVCTD